MQEQITSTHQNWSEGRVCSRRPVYKVAEPTDQSAFTFVVKHQPKTNSCYWILRIIIWLIPFTNECMLSKSQQEITIRSHDIPNYPCLGNPIGYVHMSGEARYQKTFHCCLNFYTFVACFFFFLHLKFVLKGGRWGVQTQQTNNIFLAS